MRLNCHSSGFQTPSPARDLRFQNQPTLFGSIYVVHSIPCNFRLSYQPQSRRLIGRKPNVAKDFVHSPIIVFCKINTRCPISSLFNCRLNFQMERRVRIRPFFIAAEPHCNNGLRTSGTVHLNLRVPPVNSKWIAPLAFKAA